MATKIRKILLSAAVVAAVAMLSSSCVVVVDDGVNGAEIRYTWAGYYNNEIVSIRASYSDVDYWYENVWYKYYPNVPLEASHTPKYEGSTQIPNGIYSGGNTRYKGVYHKISKGTYTAVCTVEDPLYEDIYDIVANYEIIEYYYLSGQTTYYELAFDVGRFLSGGTNRDKYFEFDYYDNRNESPILKKSAESTPLINVVEDENVTYYVFRRPKV